MFISTVLVVILGTSAAGGPSEIIRLTSKGERFIFGKYVYSFHLDVLLELRLF